MGLVIGRVRGARQQVGRGLGGVAVSLGEPGAYESSLAGDGMRG